MTLLLVDGYNVLHGSDRYRALLDEDPETARAALVADVAAYAHGRYRSVVVFDGGGNPASDGAPHHVAGVVVIFSPSGRDADAVVESIARRDRDRGEEVVVVTSDAATQWTVVGKGVSRLSASGFADAVATSSGSWQAHTPSGRRRGPLEDRIDPSVRDTLSRWARGTSAPRD